MTSLDYAYEKNIINNRDKILMKYKENNWYYINNSISNYNTTTLSLASIFNLSSINTILPNDKIYKNHKKFYPNMLYSKKISLKDKSYFADGLTEELINRLSRIQNLKVRLRTDVAIYKDKKTSLHEIAKELKVNYIVEGSVRIIDDELRVNAKLFDISNDIIIWSESYKRQLIDIYSTKPINSIESIISNMRIGF